MTKIIIFIAFQFKNEFWGKVNGSFDFPTSFIQIGDPKVAVSLLSQKNYSYFFKKIADWYNFKDTYIHFRLLFNLQKNSSNRIIQVHGNTQT